MALPQMIKEMLDNGVHFGHLRKHWNPRMEKYIYGRKKNIFIIDLQKTANLLLKAQDFIREVVKNGGKVLFVSTKRQTKEIVKELAISCNMPYMVERWIGGLITNFSVIKKQIDRYKELKDKRDKGEFDKLTKKETVLLNKRIDKMHLVYEGLINLDKVPHCLYIVDPKREITAVKEARRLNIPIVGLIDTDGDPTCIDYPIPGNDDAIKSVRYITGVIAQTIQEEIRKLPLIGIKGEEEEKKEEEKDEEDIPLDTDYEEEYEE